MAGWHGPLSIPEGMSALMLTSSSFAKAMAFAAALVAVTPAAPLLAETKSEEKVVRSLDITLVKGELHGKLLSAHGEPLKGAPVSVTRNNKVVARTLTAEDGSYAVTGLTPGVHVVGLSEGNLPVRLWNQGSAPTSSRSTLTLSQTAVRGQYVTDNDLLAGTAVVAFVALAVAIVALNEPHDNDSPASP